MPEITGFVNNIGLLFAFHGILTILMILIGLVAWSIAKAFIRSIK